MSSTSSPLFVPWFRAAAPYIHAYRGKTFVIAMVGEAVAEGQLQYLVQDMAMMQSMGTHLVLVHGSRPQLAAQLAAKGHITHFEEGIRITDAVALQCAQEAAGQLRYKIEAAFSQSLAGTPMSGATIRVMSGNFITAQPRGVRSGVDFEYTGQVRKVDVSGLQQVLDLGSLALISPFGFSPTGQAFNLSMEEVATSVAIALKADKLIFVCGLNGIPTRWEDADSPIETELVLQDAETLLKTLPPLTHPRQPAFYLQHCIKACKAGVPRSHVIPFSVAGSLLLEVYTHEGIGTMVVDEQLDALREAQIDDVSSILRLIEPWENDGTLIKRSRRQIENEIHNYTVLEHDGVLLGCAALYPYPESQMAEMASLSVSPLAQGQGEGERILRHLEKRAVKAGISKLFVLTTRSMDWFLKRGFKKARLQDLPPKRQAMYDKTRKSKVLIKTL